jgi:hypothetical protein
MHERGSLVERHWQEKTGLPAQKPVHMPYVHPKFHTEWTELQLNI